ncbi:hypothetical protein N7488_008665 [Penicillium malachiteum]|nr:hypothetical protein N7488_008665 [Penicillium malachiteum]
MKDRLANTNTKLQQLLSLTDCLLECIVEERPADNKVKTKYREIRHYLEMSSLTYEDVEDLFDIHRVHQGIMKTWCEPECIVGDVLLEMQLEVQNTIPMNLFLFYARQLAQEILNPNLKAASESEPELQTNRSEVPRIQAENSFVFKSVLCTRKLTYNIGGRPDYSVWFGDEISLQSSLVVVESKPLEHRPDRNDARCQLLCYMAMVYKARRDAGKTDCRVWGVATIGSQFYFLHITDSGNWAQTLVDMSPRMDSEGLNKILAILTEIIVDGAKQTPVPLFNLNAPLSDARGAFRSRDR